VVRISSFLEGDDHQVFHFSIEREAQFRPIFAPPHTAILAKRINTFRGIKLQDITAVERGVNLARRNRITGKILRTIFPLSTFSTGSTATILATALAITC